MMTTVNLPMDTNAPPKVSMPLEGMGDGQVATGNAGVCCHKVEETKVEPDGSIVHKCADAGTNNRAEEVHGNVVIFLS